ncbi:MAG: DUF4115 domain-containing protein, partial [Calditerrivibrio sp.]|nr:DUF4115 domain-containing protein [Calditerrivibrio sp.]
LPSYVHCYGFVKNYINFLKLDEKEAMEHFLLECPKSLFSKKPDIEEKAIFNEVNGDTCKFMIKKRIVLYLIVSISFILMAGIYLLLGNNKPSTNDNMVAIIPPKQDNTVDRNPLDNKLQDNGVVDNHEILVQLSDNSHIKNDNRSDNLSASYPIKLKFYNTCWVNVRIDNITEMDFIAKPGVEKEFSFKKFFIIDIGDSSAISINYNGQTIGGLGKPKESVKNLYFTISDNKLVYTKK